MARGQDAEFKGNVKVAIEEKDDYSYGTVRIWVCNENGENIFRFKAIGKVYHSDADIVVTSIKKEEKS